MKSLRILSNPEEIRFIGNERAYAMLNLNLYLLKCGQEKSWFSAIMNINANN